MNQTLYYSYIATSGKMNQNYVYFYIDCIFFRLILLLSFLSINGVSQSTIGYLPGLDGPLPFELETGYISLDDSRGVEFFYYFFKSENNPSKDPLLVWFTGGPGCSGLSAILFENGPFKLKVTEYNGSLPNLELNKYSWTKVSSIVYIDAPVGTGFSYATTKQGSYSNDDIAGKDGYNFIRKWLIQHPQYISNSLYIGGDSYSGKTVPVVARDISDGIELGDKPPLNFKGYLLGNPITDRTVEINHIVPYAYGMGIISYELFESAKRNCKEEYVDVDPTNIKCVSDLLDVNKCTDGLNDQQILEPKCIETPVQLQEFTTGRRSLEENTQKTNFLRAPTPHFDCKPKAITINIRQDKDNSRTNILSPPPISDVECRTYGYMLSYYWANDIDVLKALNIRKGTVREWLRANQCGINYSQNIESTISYHLALTKRNYRSLIYSGDHDLGVPHLGTQAWIKSLNYSILDDWRPWTVDLQVAGYTRTYSSNMTFATVKGAGHVAIEYKHKECFAMFKRWLSEEPL